MVLLAGAAAALVLLAYRAGIPQWAIHAGLRLWSAVRVGPL
jgi:hypothetical protein